MGGGAGTKSIAAMCKAVVFRFVPTLIEIVALASVLARLFHPALGVVVAATSVAYTCYTIYMTQVRPPGNAATNTGAIGALLSRTRNCGSLVPHILVPARSTLD